MEGSTSRSDSRGNNWDRPTNIPVPDPSQLTTEQLLREIGHAVELINMRIDGVVNTADQRYELTRELLDTILQSQKESADKAEASIMDKLDSVIKIMDTKDIARQAQARELEKRVDRSEGKGIGVTQSWGVIVAVVTIIILLVSLAVSFGSTI